MDPKTNENQRKYKKNQLCGSLQHIQFRHTFSSHVIRSKPSMVRLLHNCHSETSLLILSKMYVLLMYMIFSHNLHPVTSLLVVSKLNCFTYVRNVFARFYSMRPSSLSGLFLFADCNRSSAHLVVLFCRFALYGGRFWTLCIQA